MPLSIPVNWASVSSALGGQADPNANYVFKSDGAGSGQMTTNTQVIPQRITVGQSGDVDYTSIAAAVAAAISGGASGTVPWEILVAPGTYTEPPMTIQAGVTLHATTTRLDTVYVIAQNPAADLFTFTSGGSVSGINASGVTDPAKAVFRASTPNTLAVMHGCSVTNCSTGVLCEGGAKIVLTYFSVNITAPSIGVTKGISVTGAGSYVGAVSPFFSAPAALLPYYASNPIGTCVNVDAGAEAYVVGGSFRAAPKNSVADVFHADDGSSIAVMASEVSDSGNAFHIGAAGTNTTVTVSAISLKANTLNFWAESSTGAFFSGATSTDVPGTTLVTGAKLIGLLLDRTSDVGKLVGNEWKYEYADGKSVKLSTFFNDVPSTGLSTGGVVTDGGGLTVDVALGSGWIVRGSPNYDAFDVSWAAVTGLALTALTTNYVCYDSATDSIVSQLSPTSNLQILLATVVTDGSGIRYLHTTTQLADQIAERTQEFMLVAHPITANSGMATSQGSTNRKFGVASGSYFRSLSPISYAGSGTDATFSYFYGTNGATEVASQTQLDITNYDNAGTLTAMTAGYFRADTVFVTSDGRVSVVYGTAQYATQAAAEAAPLGNVPTFIEPTGYSSSMIVVEQGVGIASILDERPYFGAGGTGAGGVSVHGALSGLLADDHPQYLLVSGTRAMSGDLDVGGNDITNVGLVDGVDVPAHASRHNPGGVDAIATATPVAVSVGAAAAEGSAASVARSDHQHGITAGTPVTISTANAAGSASSVARSDHVHAHGNLPGGSTHAVAVASVSAGYISAADQAKLDGIASGATNTPLSNTAPVDVAKTAASAGVAAQAARQDHQHSITTAAASSLVVGGASSEGSASTLARSDHSHGITRGSVVSVGTANAAGTSSSFAGADHVHAGLTRDAGDFSTFPALSPVAGSDVILVEDSGAAGAKKSVVLSSVVNLGLTSSAPADVTKAAASVGVATSAARADHKHDISTAAPGTIAVGAAAAEGTATSLARSDHTHALTAPAAPADVTKAAASAGVATTVARSDHKHDISTAAPGTISVGDAAAEGAASSLARSDHTHALSAPAAPADVTKAAASAGVATTVARSDHKHDVSTAAAVAVGTANAEGAAASLARSDHTHQVTGLTISGQAQGDVLYFNGTSWVRLAPGTSGQVLQTNGAAANPSWVTPGVAASTFRQSLFTEISANTTATSAAFATLLSQSITITSGGIVIVHFSVSASTNGTNQPIDFRLSIDGVAQRAFTIQTRISGSAASGAIVYRKSGLSVGAHTVLMEWRSPTAQMSVQPVANPNSESACLLVEETGN